MKYEQHTFINGLDFLAPDTQISKAGYLMLVNARQRLGYIEANKKPTIIDTIPEGKKQGIIGVGNILIAFVAGRAYYNVDGSTLWLQVANFEMDDEVDIYYSIALPASSFNYVRKLNPDENVASGVIKTQDFTIDGSPAGVLVQDGINQPWLIFFNSQLETFTSRVTQNYTQWTNDGVAREYVPVGTFMSLIGTKLMIISTDKKRVFHSITGRPLDFMIVVDVDGNKLPTELQGGADVTSFAFDDAEITALVPLNIADSFLYCTKSHARIITFDYTNTIFGEPDFTRSAFIVTGTVNHDSVVDILGDYAMIDFEGVKSFNAVMQLKFEGRNSIFSLQLSRILNNIKQENPRCIAFENFAIFNLQTIYGNVFVIYDTLLQKWVALDIIPVIDVKQFAITKTTTAAKLYAITDLDELYELYSSDELESPQLYCRTFVAEQGELMYQQKGEYLKCIFQDGHTNTNVNVVEMIDGQFSQRGTELLTANIAGVGPGPIIPPVIPSNRPRNQSVTFNLTHQGLKGYKVTYIIQWSSNAKLQAIELLTSDDRPMVDNKQAQETYATNS